MKKNQILIIHGGMTFSNRKSYLRYLKTRKITLEKKQRWSGTYLDKALGEKFEIIRPRMPLQDNAKYEDWKIHFERHLPYLQKNSILIGVSLGGIFLAKYLSENTLPKKALSTFLVSAPFDNTAPGEELVGGFKLRSNLSRLEKNSVNTYLMFSKDDDVVPVAHARKYSRKLPNANVIIYPSKNGHFNISKFPEIVSLIRRDVRRR